VSYAIKEIYLTLQGEGANVGRSAVFCRFTGCNLWSGREEDRAEAVCRFCDTNFVGTDGVGGGTFESASDLANVIVSKWPGGASGARPFVVFTGGEPLLQLDETLVAEMHARDFEVAVETNGTRRAPAGLDWVCVSPKAGADIVLTEGSELKLVFPQPGAEPERYAGLSFRHFSLQPMDGPNQAANTRAAIEYCLKHPAWRLSLQTHKFLSIP